MREGIDLSASHIKPGDKILISGSIGDHGIAIISTREELSFSTQIESDAAPLNHMIAAVLDACPAGSVRAFRDPTRGGLASTLNDVFQVANEGKMVCVCAPEVADAALAAMRTDKYGAEAAIVGEVLEGEGRVYLRTAFGSERILDMLVGEQLPRIC